MADDFSFDNINATEFENFCYELLDEIGFINLNWRKGTGLSSSPADDGRDIECELERTYPDGTNYHEKWFVDSKHYKKGIPVSAIINVLNWAQAERPDVVLIITSNFLSNSAKRHIEKYKENNKPSFAIKIWEKPNLEKLTLNKHNLLKKYKIPNPNFPFLNLMHPAHLWYIRNPPINTLDYLFNLIESIDNEKRDKFFAITYNDIINPRYSKPITNKEKMSELLLDKVDYDSFKNKVYSLSNLISEQFLIISIITFTLGYNFGIADKTVLKQRIKTQEGVISNLEKMKSGELEYGFDVGLPEEEINEQLDDLIKKMRKWIKDMPKDVKEYNELYNYFCDNIISELFKEEVFLR